MSGYIDRRHSKNKELWSKPAHKIQVQKDVQVKMRDGKNIFVDIYLPAGEKGRKFPALLALSPFGKDSQEMARWLPHQPWFESIYWDGNLEAGDIDYIVSRGYAFVIADPKGIGRSEGEYVGLLGSMGQDGYDLIEWMATQPWCDGKIGMTGICIFSAAQLLTAAEQPPHLKAIAPFETWGDVYRSLAYHGGELFLMQHSVYKGKHANDSGWTLGNVASITMKSRPKEEVDSLIEAALRDPDIKYNSKFYTMLKYPQIDPIFIDFLLNPTDGPFWWEMSPYTKFHKINVPVYSGSPWCLEIFTLNIFGCYENVKPAPKVLMWPPGLTERPNHQYHDELMRWFDYHLKGIDTGIMDEPPIKMFVMGAGKWRYEKEWPLARTLWSKAYLHPYGRLMPHPVDCEFEPDSFTQPPLFVDPTVHTLQYKTPPFSDDTEVTGPIALYLHMAIDTDDTNLMVDLMDVDVAGNEIPISRGYLKASHRETDETKSKPYKPFHPHTNPRPVIPGEINEYAVELMPVSNLFRSGHSLKLVIRSQDDLLHSRVGLWGLGHLPAARTVTHKIYRERGHQSYLLLPIIPKSDEALWIEGS
ncbi:MAG: CocE/NonD family hydrolase [Thermodesulfobacteriota bacterium]